MAKYIVTYTGANGVKAYAAGLTKSMDEYAYSFAPSEAMEYEWQGDAINACRVRNENDSYFLHDSAENFILPSEKVSWDYEKIG